MPKLPPDDQADEHSLFRRMMHDVKPLAALTPRAPKPARARLIEVPRPRTRLAPEPTPTPNHTLSDPYDITLTAESVLCYGQNRIPMKRFRELKQGDIPTQARLDLHGLRLSAASEALTHFITQQQAHGTRCVLIIHGKGGQHGEPSILKSHVNHWLKQFSEILAFHSARPQAGGTGAVYVLLKKESQSS